jgi:hypothetical protein
VAGRRAARCSSSASCPGDEHRLLVVGGKLVAAARGETASVVGDGVDDRRADRHPDQHRPAPRRPRGLRRSTGPDREPAVRLELKRQGFAPDSVPAARQESADPAQRQPRLDVTDEVHPEVAEAAALAARIVGLDIAGIDLVAEDISRPLAAQRGAIVEVNAGPGLLMHLKPARASRARSARPSSTTCSPRTTTAASRSSASPAAGTALAVARLVSHLLQLDRPARRPRLPRRPVPRPAPASTRATAPAGRRPAACSSTAASTPRCSRTAPRRSSTRASPTTAARSASSPTPIRRLTLGEFDIETPTAPEGAAHAGRRRAARGHRRAQRRRPARRASMAELCDGEVIFYDPARNAAIAAHRAQRRPRRLSCATTASGAGDRQRRRPLRSCRSSS